MAINKNATVKVISGHNKGRVGKVVEVFDFVDTVFVSFEDNGDVAKVSLSALVEFQPEKTETNSELLEGAKKISRAEFRAALEKVTHPDNIFTESSGGMSAFVRGVTTMIVGAEVERAIFKDQDGVVMREEEFISALWSACNPVALSENVKKGMSASKCIHVAMTALIGLEEIAGILFGGSDD